MVYSPSTLSDGRYKVLAALPNLNNLSYIDRADLQTFLVQDTKTSGSPCRTLRLAKKGSKPYDWFSKHFDTLKGLEIEGKSHKLILSPIDHFEITDKGATYTAWVYEEILGPDVEAMTMQGGDPNNFHEPTLVRQLARTALEGLQAVHSKGVTAGYFTGSAVITYPKLAGADSDTILEFFKHDGQFVVLNESSTGPQGAPFDAEAVAYKTDRLDPAAEFATHYVPETAFGEQAGEKSDLWMLAAVLYNLTAQVPEEVYGIMHATSQQAKSAVQRLPAGRPKGIVMSTELLGSLPSKYLDRLPRDARTVIDSKSVKFNPNQLYEYARSNVFADKTPQEKRISDDDLDSLADLLKNMLAFDPDARFTAEEALQHAYFETR